MTGETNYWFRTWADPDAYCGRRSGLFDKDGNEVMTFEGEQNASMQNSLLVLQEVHAVNGSYEHGYADYGTCQVIDLSTGADATTALSLSYAPDVLNDWVELDTCHASGEPTDETLYNPATGEGFTGFRQVCGSGTACFETSDGRYELRDLATVDRTLIGTFDAQPSS